MRHKKKLIALGLIVGAPLVAHAVVHVATPISPPSIASETGEPTIDPRDPDLRTLGEAYARHRGKILEVRLEGSPERIGHDHARLLYDEMKSNEGVLYGEFEHYVPIPPLRWLITDVSRVQFRDVDRGMTDARRREIAAQAAAFQPDPFSSFLPTYHRFVFLQSLYDIALSFEHSPLMGCSSFALRHGAFQDGHVVLARNFDFEAGPVFDLGKAVFFVREEGKIPYASVAWPGLVGAMSGMNAEGLALVVHGGRAKHPTSVGEPVLHQLRDVLAEAKNTKEALAILGEKAPMVSHFVMLADASGDVAIAERAPNAPMFVRRPEGDRIPLTNHFEGPFADDPANLRVREKTSTLPRRARLDAILSNLPEGIDVEGVVGVLRDKKAADGTDLPLGDRRALDALIATHSVVMDVTAKKLWVSEGPHLAGRYLAFDVGRLLDPKYEPSPNEPLDGTIAPDPIEEDGRYEAWEKNGRKHSGEHP